MRHDPLSMSLYVVLNQLLAVTFKHDRALNSETKCTEDLHILDLKMELTDLYVGPKCKLKMCKVTKQEGRKAEVHNQ